MKILVAVKAPLTDSSGGMSGALGNQMIVGASGHESFASPFDFTGLKEAIASRDRGEASEVVAMCAGGLDCRSVLNAALDIGADRAIHVWVQDRLQPFGVAKILRGVAVRESATLIVVGKQADDDRSHQIARLVAGMADVPHLVFAGTIVIEQGNALIRELIADGSEREAIVPLPAILSRGGSVESCCTKRRRCRAKVRGTIDILHLGHLGVDISPRHRFLEDGGEASPAKGTAERARNLVHRQLGFEGIGRMQSVLVVADTARDADDAAILPAIAASSKLGFPVDVLLDDERKAWLNENFRRSNGIRTVLTYRANDCKSRNGRSLKSRIAQLSEHYSHIFFGDTPTGLRRAIDVAGNIAIAPILKVSKIVDVDTFECLNTVSGLPRRVQARDPVVVATISSDAFETPGIGSSDKSVWNWTGTGLACRIASRRLTDRVARSI